MNIFFAFIFLRLLDLKMCFKRLLISNVILCNTRDFYFTESVNGDILTMKMQEMQAKVTDI